MWRECPRRWQGEEIERFEAFPEGFCSSAHVSYLVTSDTQTLSAILKLLRWIVNCGCLRIEARPYVQLDIPLSPEQRAAVHQPHTRPACFHVFNQSHGSEQARLNTPLLVLAGPGSGKTHFLAKGLTRIVIRMYFVRLFASTHGTLCLFWNAPVSRWFDFLEVARICHGLSQQVPAEAPRRKI